MDLGIAPRPSDFRTWPPYSIAFHTNCKHLLNAYYVPGTILSVLQMLAHLKSITTPLDMYY